MIWKDSLFTDLFLSLPFAILLLWCEAMVTTKGIVLFFRLSLKSKWTNRSASLRDQKTKQQIVFSLCPPLLDLIRQHQWSVDSRALHVMRLMEQVFAFLLWHGNESCFYLFIQWKERWQTNRSIRKTTREWVGRKTRSPCWELRDQDVHKWIGRMGESTSM